MRISLLYYYPRISLRPAKISRFRPGPHSPTPNPRAASRVWLRLAALWLSPVLAFAQTPDLPGCKPADAIHEAIQEARKTPEGDTRPYTEIQKDHAARLKALVEKHSQDFFVRRAYIETARVRMVAPESIIEEDKQRLEQSPNDPAAQYLYAFALLGRRTPDAIPILTNLADQHPKFAWPSVSLSDIYGYPAFRDAAKQASNAQAYVGACPDNINAYTRLSRLPNSPFLKEAAARLRQLLAGRTDNEALGAWPSLWNLEFKVTPVSEHPPLRTQVEQDLAALKSLDPEKHKSIGYVLREGYKVVGDKEGEKAGLGMDKARAAGMSQAIAAMNDWSKKNPIPKPGEPGEKRKAYYEARLAASEESIKLAGADPFMMLEPIRVLAELTDRPESEFLAAVDKYFEMEKARQSSVRTATPNNFMIASLYVKRGVRLEQVPDLVREGLQQAAKRGEEMDSDLFYMEDRKDSEEASLWGQRRFAWATLFDAYLKQMRFDKARDTVFEMERGLREWKTKVAAWQAKSQSLPKDKPRDAGSSIIESAVRSVPAEEARYHESLARLAAAENRKLDALGFYQTALRTAKGAASAKYYEDQWTPKAQALWKELGGTTEGWQNWIEQLSATAATSANLSRPTPDRWTKMERPLPEFTVSDLAGRSWTKASLGGKTAFVNLWATWCGPCREELPHLQKLFDRVKDREDVLLITFNVDDSIGAVEPFMKENKYTFPVLLTKDVIDTYLGSWSIPRNWVVDRAGVLRFEQVGFGMTETEEWIKKMIDQIEAARGGL